MFGAGAVCKDSGVLRDHANSKSHLDAESKVRDTYDSVRAMRKAKERQQSALTSIVHLGLILTMFLIGINIPLVTFAALISLVQFLGVPHAGEDCVLNCQEGLSAQACVGALDLWCWFYFS